MARIIIEGMNGVGKTTLANKLAKELGYTYLKDDRKNQKEKDGLKLYHALVQRLPDNVILDRFHLGEYVYPRLHQDGRKGLEFWEQHLLERLMNALKYILIYVEADQDFVEKTYKTRGEDSLTIDQTIAERCLFNQVFDKTLLIKIKYNVVNDPFDKLVNAIKIAINIIAEKSLLALKFQSCGNLVDPKIMLVGDRINENKYRKDLAIHAFSSCTGSSAFLHKVLEEVCDESRLAKDIFYFTNAFKYGKNIEQNVSLLFQELCIYDNKKIICLGNASSNFLTKLGIKHFKISHPSYIKRFAFNIHDYAMGLWRAISYE